MNGFGPGGTVEMPKNKPHKGLLKRVRITKSGKIKMHRAFGRHLRSHKSGQLMRSYRKATFAHPSDVGRLSALLGLKTRLIKKAKPAAEADAKEDKPAKK